MRLAADYAHTDLDTPLPTPLPPSSYTIEADGTVSAPPSTPGTPGRKRKPAASENTALVVPEEEADNGCQCVIV